MALSLQLSPHGRLALVDSADPDTLEPALRAALTAAFADSAESGLFHLGAVVVGAALPPDLHFWRSLGRAFGQAVCAQPAAEVGASSLAVPMPATLAETLTAQAPGFIGVEFLSAEVVARLWAELQHELERRLAAEGCTAAALLQRLHPAWHSVGRVHVHLAENKRDVARPFAFLATYTATLSAQARAQHLPLGQALQAYAGAGDRETLKRLLEPLQRAAQTSKLLEGLIESKAVFHPQAWTAEEAYRFLRDVPAMEAAGLVVRVPDWWRARPRPQAQVSVGARPPSGLSLGALLDFNVALTLDGAPLSAEEQRMLLKSSAGLVLLRGKWVEVEPDKLKKVLAQWASAQAAAESGLSMGEALRLLAGVSLGSDASSELGEAREWSQVVAGPWLQHTLDGLQRPEARKAFDPGAALQASLRPYQRAGVEWLGFLGELGLGACLADDMGLGKTIQVIALWLALKKKGPRPPHLLVAPTSLLANWKAELARFGPSLRVLVAHPSEVGSKAFAALSAAALAKHDVVLTSYGSLGRAASLASQQWDIVVLDEAQAVKNPGAQQTKRVKALHARHRVALSGTPVENRLGDLWSLFDFLNPGLLGSAKAFTTFSNKLAKDPKASYAPLRRLVRPYLLRRLKTDKSVISDLPDKVELKVHCGLSAKQAKLYQQVVKELAQKLEDADGMARRGLILSVLLRLKQLCNHPAQWLGSGEFLPDESGKFLRVAQLAEEIAARQEKVLVFTQFREMTAPLQAHLTQVFGRPGLVLDGTTKPRERQALVDRFQNEERVPFFVLSVKAGGTGLNLTAASHVIHFDRWWNPAVENQATDRAFRIGQKKNVMVHKLVCLGTVEEKIDALIEGKRDLSDNVLSEGGELLLTEMSNADVLKLVSLDLARAQTEAE